MVPDNRIPIAHEAFDMIDSFASDLVKKHDFTEEQIAELAGMLSEHYGNVAEEHNSIDAAPAADDDADPYADQEYCKHCGSELAFKDGD